MTTYLIAEGALLTLCRAYSAGAVFTTANSSADDWTVIDTADTSLLIEMGEQTQEGIEQDDYEAHGEYQEQHTIDVWICQKRSAGATGDGTIKQGLKTLTEALKDYLRPYRRLNAASGVRSMAITSTLPPAYVQRIGGRGVADASHLTQRIRCVVLCESTAAAGETDG